MNSPESVEPIARLVLGATTSGEPAGNHLDENDLALLEMNSLSHPERKAIRQHLETCDACRRLASRVLKRDKGGGHVRRQRQRSERGEPVVDVQDAGEPLV